MYIIGLSSTGVNRIKVYKFVQEQFNFELHSEYELEGGIFKKAGANSNYDKGQLALLSDLKCVELENRKISTAPKLVGSTIARCMVYHKDTKLPQIALILTLTDTTDKNIDNVKTSPSKNFYVEVSAIKIPSNLSYPMGSWYTPDF